MGELFAHKFDLLQFICMKIEERLYGSECIWQILPRVKHADGGLLMRDIDKNSNVDRLG